MPKFVKNDGVKLHFFTNFNFIFKKLCAYTVL